MNNSIEVLTVGHSNHPFEGLLALLLQHSATVVADVRSAPYSRRYPQFSRRALEGALESRDIHYRFLGEELGARTQDPACYDEEGRVRFSRLADTALFRRGIARVIEQAAGSRIALLCAERDPARCHRAILVAPALSKRGVSVAHILGDGGLESQEALLDRLCDEMRMAPHDIFRSRSQQRKAALAHRERKIAYFDPARAPNPAAAEPGRNPLRER